MIDVKDSSKNSSSMKNGSMPAQGRRRGFMGIRQMLRRGAWGTQGPFSPCAHASPCIYPLNARKGGFGGMLGAHGSAHLARPQSWHRELILSQLLRARRQCRGRWLPPGRAARDGCRTARSARRCRRSRAGRLVSSRRALMLFSNAAPQELIKSCRDCKVGPFRPVRV